MVLERAREKGVVSMVVAGVSAARWESLCRVTAEHPGLYPAYGLHPMFMREHKQGDVERLDDFLNSISRLPWANAASISITDATMPTPRSNSCMLSWRLRASAICR